MAALNARSTAGILVLALTLSVMASSISGVEGALSTGYYEKKCPELTRIVYSEVEKAIKKEARMGASLLRLHFHDCFVQGCDASILLDDTSSFTGEKTAGPNNNSIRGFDVIDKIKAKVEACCPGIVSCADIVALASRDSVHILKGPFWKVPLGRRDSRSASAQLARTNLAPPTANLSTLISLYEKQGLSATDMVALSGGHTVGMSQCKNFRARIYKDSNINPIFANAKKRICPVNSGDTRLAPLDDSTKLFDNAYFQDLLLRKGLLHSDQALYDGGSTDSLVLRYALNQKAFFEDFVTAMIKMGNISPLTGSKGEIRKNCRKMN